MDTEVYTRRDTTRDPYPGHRGHPADTDPLFRRDRVYAQLREELLNGRIGIRERLAEVRLAARLGVSRTPVREALARLRADGLVERGDGGYFAAVPNLAQLRDLYELRVTLELRGVARAIEDPSLRHDPAVIEAELKRWYEVRDATPEPDPRFVVLDEEFHTALSRAAGNPALTEALVAVNQKIRRVRMYDFLTRDRVETTIAEHIDIMECVRDGRLEEGHRALHAHVGDSMAVVLERAQRALTQMALHT